MKILVNQGELEGLDRKLADLFRAAPRFQADPFCKRRVLVRVERLAATRLPRFRMRPAVIAALLMSGSAAAALGQRYVSRSGSFRFSAPFTDDRGAGVVANRAPAPAPSPGGRPLDSRLTSEQAPLPPADTLLPDNARARPHVNDDPLTVTEAIRALRTDHDTARAEHLLDEYLMRHPHGLLSEDALALSIEAAATEHDPRAIANARRYLASFPHGKYRAFARRVADAPK